MRVPKIENYYEGNKYKEIVKIKGIEKANKHIMLSSDKDKKQFIFHCEKLIRGSIEYRDYVKYLKENIDMTQCSFFSNLDTTKMKKIRLELHHALFSLFDITCIVVNKHLSEGKDLDYFDVAEEVMKIHYQGRVALVPLSVTVHKLVHEGKIFIPVQSVYGKYLDFIDEYYDYMGEYIEMIKENIKISKEIQDQGYQDLTILNKKYIYLEVDGMTFPNLIEEK